MSKIGANEIREGNVIRVDGRLCVVKTVNKVKPGKGKAYVQLDMKDCVKGSSVHARLESSVWVDKPIVDERAYTCMYSDGKKVALMNSETFEQEEYDIELFGKSAVYLKDGMQVVLVSCESMNLGAKVPETVECEIVETEAVVKGQTAAASYKPALLDNGLRVSVPPFVKVGDKILVKTDEGVYYKRTKGEV